MIPAYLTRRSNGLYLLTYKRPVITHVGRTEKLDAYPEPGDALAYNNMCPWSVQVLFGVELEPLQSVRVKLSGERIEQPASSGVQP